MPQNYLIISEKKWFCMSWYCTPNHKVSFFCLFLAEIALSLKQADQKFEDLIIMCYFNIGVNYFVTGKDELDEFWNLFSMANLVKEATGLIILRSEYRPYSNKQT